MLKHRGPLFGKLATGIYRVSPELSEGISTNGNRFVGERILEIKQLKNWGHFCPTKPTDPEKALVLQSTSFNMLRDALSLVQRGKLMARLPIHRVPLGLKKLKNPMAEIRIPMTLSLMQ